MDAAAEEAAVPAVPCAMSVRCVWDNIRNCAPCGSHNTRGKLQVASSSSDNVNNI